jgi:8-oxo-dGTP diphosphatase
MNGNTLLELKPAGTIDPDHLTYVIIGSRENGKWIFVRHRERQTWELPAGHIEPGESVRDAAERELYEETGVVKADLHPLYDYTVTVNEVGRSGRIYLAHVKERGQLPGSEIEEIRVAAQSPEPATYPEVHWQFIQLLEEFIHHNKTRFD